MRNLISIILAACLFFSCDEKTDSNVDTSALKDNLCNKTWKMTASSVTPAMAVYDTNEQLVYTEDMFAYYDECEKDNITVFKTDGTYLINNHLLCGDGDLQTESGTWEISSNGETLTISNSFGSFDLKILVLSETTFKYQFEVTNNGTTYSHVVTLVSE